VEPAGSAVAEEALVEELEAVAEPAVEAAVSDVSGEPAPFAGE
jgi:hypothetical protein